MKLRIWYEDEDLVHSQGSYAKSRIRSCMKSRTLKKVKDIIPSFLVIG